MKFLKVFYLGLFLMSFSSHANVIIKDAYKALSEWDQITLSDNKLRIEAKAAPSEGYIGSVKAIEIQTYDLTGTGYTMGQFLELIMNAQKNESILMTISLFGWDNSTRPTTITVQSRP